MMNGMIDMTTANPYISKESNSKKRARSSPVPNDVPPKVPLNFKTSTLATMKALATQQQRLQAIQQTRQQPQQQQKGEQLQDDDQTMKSAHSRLSAGSLLSGSTFYSAMDQGGDDCSHSSSSSWSNSEDEEDEYEMYAPTAIGGRGHLLRPMSLDQITALAVATGARKPSCLQRNSFSQALLKQQPMAAVQRVPPKQQSGAARPSHRSASMPDIASQILHYRQMNGAQQSNSTSSKEGGSSSAPIKPDDRLKAILKAEGKTIEYCPYSSLNEFFLKVEPQHIQAFQQDIISAVRGKSVENLKALANEGKMLQCCNKFGESIVHMACRQSSTEVLEFLMTEAKVNIRVCCDSGRTPLHDACWTTNPNFGTIKRLLKECPDFLKIKDKRGFSPLAYVPHGQWGQWGDFLEKNKDLLVFRELK